MNTCNTCKFFSHNNSKSGLCAFMNTRIDKRYNNTHKTNIKKHPEYKSIIINSTVHPCVEHISGQKFSELEINHHMKNSTQHNWVWVDINFGCVWHTPHALRFNPDKQRELILKYFPDASNFLLHRKYNNKLIKFCSKEIIKSTKIIYLEDGLKVEFENCDSIKLKNRKRMYYSYDDKLLEEIISNEHT